MKRLNMKCIRSCCMDGHSDVNFPSLSRCLGFLDSGSAMAGEGTRMRYG
jgi:hypothetical protein